MIKKLKSIWTSLSFRITIVLLLLMWGIAYLFTKGVSTSLSGLTNARDGIRLTHIISRGLTDRIQQTEHALEMTAIATMGQTLTAGQLQQLVDSIEQVFDVPRAYALTRANEVIDIEQARRKAISTHAIVWSQPYMKAEPGKEALPTVTCLMPLFAQGRCFAVLCSDLQITHRLQDYYIPSEYPNSFMTLEDPKTGVYLDHYDSLQIMQPVNAVVQDSIRKYYSTGNAEIKPLGWLLNCRVNLRDVNEETNVINIIIYIVTGWLFLMLGLVIFFVLRWQIKPLRKIAEAADAVSHGDFEAELPKIWADTEIRRLRNSFQRMQMRLVHYIDDLRDTTEKKAAFERDMTIAEEIQQDLLPKDFPAFPDRNDLDIYGMQKTARQVGGDLFDFYIHDEQLFFCIGDVSGKGVGAALFMTVVCHLFRNVGRHTNDPAKITEAINQGLVVGNKKCMFCTLFTGVLNLKTYELNFCNAGHNSPIYIHQGQATFLKTKVNLPTGVFEDAVYEVQQLQLEKGDALFMYTDGVTEAANEAGEFLGDDATLACVAACPAGATMQQITRQMLDTIHAFTQGAEQSDDITILGLSLR